MIDRHQTLLSNSTYASTSRALAGLSRVLLVWGGAALCALATVLSAKAAIFGGGAAAVATAGAAAATGRAAVALTAPALAPFVDIALALVGVWVVMSAVALDTAAAGTVGPAGYYIRPSYIPSLTIKTPKVDPPFRPPKDIARHVIQCIVNPC